MTIFVAHFTLVILGRAVKPLYVSWVTTLVAPILLLFTVLLSKCFFTWPVAWFSGVLWCACLCLLIGLLFLLCLVVGSSILWYHSRLIWVTCRSPATCLIWCCLTLLAGSLSTSTLPSVILLDTKSSSHKKNQKISWCNIFAVLVGYFVRLMCTWTALYHSPMLLLP